MKKTLSLIIVLLGLSMFSMFTPWTAKAQEIVWNTNPTPLPHPTAGHSSIVHNGKTYVIGGLTTDGVRLANVYFAHINPDGTVGSWDETTSLPEWRQAQTAVVWNNFVYVIGGEGPEWGGRSEQNTVYYAEISSGGMIEIWDETTPLPERLQHHAATVWNGRIYVVGGWNGYGRMDKVWFAEINPANGSIGPWIENPTRLPLRYEQMGVAVHNGVIYLMGGWRPPLDVVYYALIDETDGTIGPFKEGPHLPKAIASVRAVLIGDDIYVVGGRTGLEGAENAEKAVYKATIKEVGTLGDWTELQSIPEGRVEHSLVTFHGRIYVIGGAHAWLDPEGKIYYSSLAPVPAAIDIAPNTLDLKSKGEWTTCYIELPEGYDVADINVSSILLNDTIPVDSDAPTVIGDYDEDGIPDLMVKFDKAEVAAYILANVNLTKLYEERFMTITLTVTGYLNDDTMFQGSNTIKVIFIHRWLMAKLLRYEMYMQRFWS